MPTPLSFGRSRLCLLSSLLLFAHPAASVHAQAHARSASAHAKMSSADVSALDAALDAYDAGKTQQAEPVLRDLARRYPGSFEANEALGSLYAEAGDPARALPFLQQACATAPQQAVARANLGAAYLKLGRGREAVEELTRAAALDPQNGATQSNLGQALMLTKEPGAAAKAFALASASAPEDRELKYNWALALYESGSPREAAALLEALPAGSTSDAMESLAADAQERAGDYGKALAHFQAAAKRNPSDANLYALIAELLRHWTWAEAIEVARFGAERYPENTHFRLAEGIADYGKSDYKQAVEVFSGLLQADPNNAAVADLLGRSCSLLADGESVGCAGIYDFAQRHPGNPVTTTYAAVAILHAPKEKQDLDRAAALLDTAIKADPKYAEAYFQLGVLEQARLRWKESAAALEESVALRPASPEAHYRLSRAYTHLGRREDAQAQIALHQTYSDQAKNHLDAKMQEVVRFLLKPS